MQQAVHIVVLPALVGQSMDFIRTITSDEDAAAHETTCIVNANLGTMSSVFASIEGATAAPPRGCADLGHLLLFADANQEVLARSIFYPISAREVFQRREVAASQSSDYTSSFLVQEATEAATPPSSTVKMIGGLTKVRSFTLDLSTRYAAFM